MHEADAGLVAAARAAATSIASLGLAGAGGVLAWFAYIDAPITDAAMGLVALGVLGTLLAVALALWSRELLLAVPAADGSASPVLQSLARATLVRATRLRRVALVLLLAALLLLAAATLATLNLRGSGAADAEDARTTALLRMPARIGC
jgi:hypothetical protein